MSPSGEKHGRHKLTLADVRWIRANYVPGNKGGWCGTCSSDTSFPALAKRFHVSPSTIRRAYIGENWR